MIEINIAKTNPNAQMPKKGSEFSNGMDIFVPSDFQPVELKPGKWYGIPSGLKFGTPPGICLLACSRSGLALKNGIVSHIQPGVIDSDYRGEVIVVVRNVSDVSFVIEPGMRIMQLVVVQSPQFNLNMTSLENLDITERNEGGFGSTGV